MHPPRLGGAPFNAGAPEHRPRRVLAVLFVLALVARAAIGLWASGRGEMEGLAWRYQRDAMALAAGYGLVRPVENQAPQVDLIVLANRLARQNERVSPAHVPPRDPARWRPSSLHPPGYAWFLSVVYRLLGEPLYLWAKTIQAILDSAACLVVYSLGKRFVSSGAGVVAGFAYAIFPPLAYIVTSRVADALIPGFIVSVFALFIRGLDTRRMRWFAASGVVLGLACLLRPDMMLLPAFLAVGVLALPRHRLRSLLGVMLLGCAALAVLLPWGIRNQRELGSFQLTSTAGGMSLYQSIGQFPNPYHVVFDDAAQSDSARRAGFEGIDDPAADRYFRRRFLDIVRHDPGLIAGQMLRRVPLGIAPLYRWGYENPAYAGHGFYDYVAREHLSAYQAMLRHPAALFAAYWDRLVFGLIGLGLFVAGVAILVVERRRWAVALLLQLPYLYLFLSHLPIVLGARLLIPGIFGQLIILGYWYERLVRRRPVQLREV